MLMAEADIALAYRKVCSHYSRGCSLLAPCCGKVYPCRVCHDDAEEHKMDRKQVQTIQCRNCNELQEVSNECTKCSIVFGNAYFCKQCRLFDDENKKQYHCDGCTICRVGGRENYFHCNKCNLCWVNSLRDSHKCKANATHISCPVCMEEIHNARDGAILLPCSHYLHHSCYVGLLENGLYKCPLCNTSMIDMKKHWQKMDEERKEWSMPRRYRNFIVQVLCQDCHETTTTQFHVVGLKCGKCGSYNTSRSGNEEIPGESADEDEDDDIEEDSDGYGFNEDDRVRLTLLRQRLGSIIRQWEQPAEGDGNSDDGVDNDRNHEQQQQNMFHSFVSQLQMFQGMLDDFSGRYDDSESLESEDTESEDYLVEESSSERSGEEDRESLIADSNTDDNIDADDEDDSSNRSSPSYSYFSLPHAINLSEIYGSGDCESNGDSVDSNSSWETEEEEEMIGETGGMISSNTADVHNVQRQFNDIAQLSGSLGSVTLEFQSDTDDSENGYDRLPIIPPCWDNGDNAAAVASVVFPFDGNSNINALRLIRSSHDYGSSSEEDSNVNCNVQ